MAKISDVLATGFGGVLPMQMARQYKADQAEEDAASAERKAAIAASGKPMKKGGSVSSRADGIAQRGKTRGKMC